MAVCVRVRLGVRIGQEQAHNTCALRCVGFIISLSARDPCNSVREEGWCEWVGKDACYRFSGLATNHPKSRLEGKLNSACQHPLRSLSLAFALLASLSLDMLWGGFVASFFQPSGRKNGKVMPVLRVLQPTVLPVNIPSGIRLVSHLMASSFSSSSCSGCLCPPERGACASRIVVYLFAVTVAL